MDVACSAAVDIPESEVSAPHLGEVVKELDCDTKHVGNPTRSPRNRCPWKNDPYHFPSYARYGSSVLKKDPIWGRFFHVMFSCRGTEYYAEYLACVWVILEMGSAPVQFGMTLPAQLLGSVIFATYCVLLPTVEGVFQGEVGVHSKAGVPSQCVSLK